MCDVGLPHMLFLLHLPCHSPSTVASPLWCGVPRKAVSSHHSRQDTGHKSPPVLSSHIFPGVSITLSLWGFGPRGNSVKRPFYKGLQHSLPLSLFTLPHLSSSLPQVFLFFLCVSGNQHRTLSYKHHVLSTSCSFPSGAQENIFFCLFSPFESASVIG